MKTNRSLIPWLALLAVAVVSTPRNAIPAPPPERHPHIRAAIGALQGARQELRTAAHDFCGHRADAVREIDATIAQLRQALACDRR